MTMHVWVLLTFLPLVCIAGNRPIPHVDNQSCSQNCSWSAYDRRGELHEYGCHLGIPVEDMGKYINSCPAPPEIDTDPNNPNTFPARINTNANFNISFYTRDKPGRHKTELCLNVSFSIDPHTAQLLQGVQFWLIARQGLGFCQNYIFDDSLDYCSAYCGDDCANDPLKIFYFDCFCGIHPGWSYLLAVRVLPFDTKDENNIGDQSTRFNAPDCNNIELKDTEDCYLSDPEKWEPEYQKIEQMCPPHTSVNITIDLPDPRLHIQSLYVFVYDYDYYVTSYIVRKLAQQHLQLDSLSLREVVNNCTTINVTSIIIDNLPSDGRFFIAIKLPCCQLKYLKNEETKTTFLLHMKEPPTCFPEISGSNFECTRDCNNCACFCVDGYNLIGNKCQAEWYPDLTVEQGFPDIQTVTISFGPTPEEYEVQNYEIAFFNKSNINAEPLFINSVMAKAGTEDVIEVIISDVSIGQYYVVAVTISEEDCPSCEFNVNQENSIYLYADPCSYNPCDVNEFCSSLSIHMFSCVCLEGYTSVKNVCREIWIPELKVAQDFPKYESVIVTFVPAPSSYGVERYFIAIFDGSPASGQPIKEEFVDVKNLSDGSPISYTFTEVPTGINYSISVRISSNECESCTYMKNASHRIHVIADPCKSTDCPSKALCVSNVELSECHCLRGYVFISGRCIGWIFILVGVTLVMIFCALFVCVIFERYHSRRSCSYISYCCTDCLKRHKPRAHHSSILHQPDGTFYADDHAECDVDFQSLSVLVICGPHEYFRSFANELCKYLECQIPQANVYKRVTPEGENLSEKCSWLNERLSMKEKVLFLADNIPLLQEEEKCEESVLDIANKLCNTRNLNTNLNVGLIHFIPLSNAHVPSVQRFKLTDDIKDLESFVKSSREESVVTFGRNEIPLRQQGRENGAVYFENLKALSLDIEVWLRDIYNKHEILNRKTFLEENDSGWGSRDPSFQNVNDEPLLSVDIDNISMSSMRSLDSRRRGLPIMHE